MTSKPSPNRICRAFTLVELLVVITIIGILAGLTMFGVTAALKAARRTQIQYGIDNINNAFQDLKNKMNEYPPNCVYADSAGNNISAIAVADLKRFLKSAFPRHREPIELIEALAGGPTGSVVTESALAGTGMRADEAVVFWLGGFSDNAQYPISGKGGPAYTPLAGQPVQAEPLDERNFALEFKHDQLGPREAETGLFTGRYLVYRSPIDNNLVRINFWTFAPENKKQPYLYFNTSRHAAAKYLPNGNIDSTYDPVSNNIVAIKRLNEGGGGRIQFANPDSFQILSAGLDDEWGDFTRLSMQAIGNNLGILYPTGPFTDALADTQVNFSDKTLADSEE